MWPSCTEWHDRLKLKQNPIKDMLLFLLIDLLKNRQQRVVLNGLFSSCTKVNASVFHGDQFWDLFCFSNIHKRLAKRFIVSLETFCKRYFIF